MNKNTKQRKKIALRNFHVDGQGSTEFDVPTMRPGGYTLTKKAFRVGFVPPTKKRQPGVAHAQLDQLTQSADAILGKSKMEPPVRESRVPKPQKPLGKIGI